jgi:hypothetical protein
LPPGNANALGTGVDSTADSTEAGGDANRVHKLGESGLARWIVAHLAAEQRLDLTVRNIAKTPFERLRHQRRQPIRGQRDAE